MGKLHICFACDAGMGSSALGASLIRRLLVNENVKVTNCAISQLVSDIDIIITQDQLRNTIKEPEKYLKIYTLNHYLDDQKLKIIAEEIKTMVKEREILSRQAIITNCHADASDEAIKAVGKVLLDMGYIEEPYIAGMLKRDHDVTTYIGNDIAIPHGEYDVKEYVQKTGLAVMIYPDGVPWNGAMARVVIGIAAKGDEHIEILSNIALKLSDMDIVNDIVANQDIEHIYTVLTTEEE